MKRRVPAKLTSPTALIALLALLSHSTVCADETTDSGEGVLVRYALLLGTADKTLPPPKSPYHAVDDVLDWDSQRDNEGLKKLLGLEAIHTLQQSSVLLDQDRGEVDLSTTVGEQRIDVDLSLEVFRTVGADGPPSPYATLWLEVKNGGKLVTAPTISSRLGERAIVTSAAPDESWALFFVVEVHDADNPGKASTEAPR